jgi:hypothetical protein
LREIAVEASHPMLHQMLAQAPPALFELFGTPTCSLCYMFLFFSIFYFSIMGLFRKITAGVFAKL